ncbi:MAG: NAD(P)H-hydrate dehydratase [Methanomassiliicoccus sp.]|nr:NAD(P)H-hydrate dehydratase [Methanomassiliicoccus sp.]
MLPFLEVRVLDINSEQFGVPIDALMENAGEAVAETIMNEVGTGKRIAVVCGVGNNAGDGFVAARNLMRHNDVTVLLANPPGDIRTEAAKRAFERVKHISSSSVGVNFSNFDIVVDALLGTGTLKEVREPYRTLIGRINDSDTMVVSVDVPSGLGTDIQIKADITVTFTEVKMGMTPENSGRIVVQDIGIPADAKRYVGPGEYVYYPVRRKDAHKGESGRLLIVGGGPFTGAPALAGLAAYRMGVDLVNIATPWMSYAPIASYSPNLIVHRLSGDNLAPEDVPAVLKLAQRADGLLIGPGLGTDEGTLAAIREIVRECTLPMVIDADAITAVAQDVSVLEGKRCVITPHSREYASLTGHELPPEMEARQADVAEAARSLGVVLLVKGMIDVISDGAWTKLNKTGNPGMSVGGTGDTLAGEVAALLSKHVSPFNAARIAAYSNGAAGDLAFDRIGYSLMATDVIDNLPEVLRRSLKKAK